MIGKLKGIIDSIEQDHILLDVGGVCYLVFVSNKTLSRLGEKGNAAELLIETHIREDHFYLFGFAEKSEREWFKILQNVQGVGAKLAMTILSTYTPSELTQAIAAQDKAMFGKISGVGPKLATRLTTELKDKVGTVSEEFKPATSSNVSTIENSAKSDAVSALTSLGIARVDAFMAVNKIATEDMKLEEMITLALNEVNK